MIKCINIFSGCVKGYLHLNIVDLKSNGEILVKKISNFAYVTILLSKNTCLQLEINGISKINCNTCLQILSISAKLKVNILVLQTNWKW